MPVPMPIAMPVSVPVRPRRRKITPIPILLMMMTAACDGRDPAPLEAQGSGAPGSGTPVSFPEVAAAAARASAADPIVGFGEAPPQFGELRLPLAGAGGDGASGDGAPVVVFLHGGCWLNSYGVDHVAPMAEALRGAGMAVWALEYRRVGDAGGGIPGTFEDLRTGWQTLERLMASHHLDPDRVILMGHSAGGHLALWLAGEAGVRVRGVISLAGITDLEAYHAPAGCGASLNGLMGGSPGDVPEAYRGYSPVTRAPLGPGTSVRLVVAEGDAIVPEGQALAYQQHDPAAHLIRVPGGHFDLIAPWAPAWPLILDLVRDLLDSPLDPS
jgi:acetyl esterase/lipase